MLGREFALLLCCLRGRNPGQLLLMMALVETSRSGAAEQHRGHTPEPIKDSQHNLLTAGARVGMNTFGSSAPLKDLLTKFGFTSGKVLAAAKEQIARSKGMKS